jgi:hypothetical protein
MRVEQNQKTVLFRSLSTYKRREQKDEKVIGVLPRVIAEAATPSYC